MVIGLDKFKDFFRGYEGSYVLIGGAASNIIEEMNLLIPRATKDLDLILIVEALSDGFVERFWQFIRDAGYVHIQKGTEKTEFYRFYQPKDASYPAQIELLSRKPDIISLPDDITIVPIPAGEDFSSLSAIMMDDDYYHLTIELSNVVDGVHMATSPALICLKAKAYLNLRASKEAGEFVNSGDITKHKNDVIRMGATLSPESSYRIPDTVKNDLYAFFGKVADDLPHEDFLKRAGIPDGMSIQAIFISIRKAFAL